MSFTLISVTYSQHMSPESWKTGTHTGTDKWYILLYKWFQLKGFYSGLVFCLYKLLQCWEGENIKSLNYCALFCIKADSLFSCHNLCVLTSPLDRNSSMWTIRYNAYLSGPKARASVEGTVAYSITVTRKHTQHSLCFSLHPHWRSLLLGLSKSITTTKIKHHKIKSLICCIKLPYSFHHNVYFLPH